MTISLTLLSHVLPHVLSHVLHIPCPVPQSEYPGHIQMLMRYVDPKSDGIVVAGGDGTIMEVLNGLLQRQDAVSSHLHVSQYIPSMAWVCMFLRT